MKIGILGAGMMARALAGKWVAAGHEVCIAGRSPEKAAELAAGIGTGAGSGTFADALGFSDTILVAIAQQGVLPTLRQAGAADGAFRGKTIIDCNNPVEFERFGIVGDGAHSLAERIQATAEGAAVVKAFNLSSAAVWAMEEPEFDGRKLVVPICSDSEAAAGLGARLVADTGCEALNLGGLHFARHLEPMSAIVISRLFAGDNPYSVFNWITPGDGAG